MDAKMARKQPASASERLRAEPSALPLLFIPSRLGLLGWHPVGLPVAA